MLCFLIVVDCFVISTAICHGIGHIGKSQPIVAVVFQHLLPDRIGFSMVAILPENFASIKRDPATVVQSAQGIADFGSFLQTVISDQFVQKIQISSQIRRIFTYKLLIVCNTLAVVVEIPVRVCPFLRTQQIAVIFLHSGSNSKACFA